MEVKIYGLSLCPCPQISLTNLFQALEDFSQQQHNDLVKYLSDDADTLPKTLEDKPLILLADYETDYKAGLLIKLRDAKSLFQISQDGSSLAISSRDFEKGQRQTELNFFLIRKDSGKGLYSYYHQSTHMNTFCREVKRRHIEIEKSLRKEIDNQTASGKITEKQAVAERKKITPFTYDILCRSEDAVTLIKGLNTVKNVTISFEDWNEQTTGDAAPLMEHAKRARLHAIFDEHTPFKTVTQMLSSMIKKTGVLKNLRVEGTDADQLDQIINLESNLESFSKKDYNNFANSLENLDLSNLNSSWTDSSALAWLKRCSESASVKHRLTK